MKIILTAVSLLLVSSLAAAVCLKGNPSITEEYADSQSVFIGKVKLKKSVPESGGYYDGEECTVEVREIFKGKPTNPIIIFSENTSGRFPMSIGETYVLFVHYELGRYQINNCGNSGLLSEKQDSVETMRQLKKSKGGRNKSNEALHGIARKCRAPCELQRWADSIEMEK
jgi:hypothetical protein